MDGSYGVAAILGTTGILLAGAGYLMKAMQSGWGGMVTALTKQNGEQQAQIDELKHQRELDRQACEEEMDKMSDRIADCEQRWKDHLKDRPNVPEQRPQV